MELKHQSLPVKKFAIYAIVAGLIYWLSQNLNYVPIWFNNLSSRILPLTVGCALAFVINIPTSFIERTLFSRSWERYDTWRQRLKRPIALFLSLCFFAVLIYAFFALLLPEINATLTRLSQQIPYAVKDLTSRVEKLAEQRPQILEFAKANNININEISSKFMLGYDKIIRTTVTSLSNVAVTIVSGFVTFILGLIFGIYIILGKEQVGREITKGLYTFFSESKVDRFIKLLFFASSMFARYISAQCLEAGILGCLVFFGLAIFKIPYALLIAVVVALFALIPIFGAYISASVGFVLILTVDPRKVWLYLLIIIVIQQIEGNIIYPFVVGSKVGLPAIWVFAAVVIGGNFFGLIGLLLSVPLCSVLYVMYINYTAAQVKDKGIVPAKLNGPAEYFAIQEDLDAALQSNQARFAIMRFNSYLGKKQADLIGNHKVRNLNQTDHHKVNRSDKVNVVSQNNRQFNDIEIAANLNKNSLNRPNKITKDQTNLQGSKHIDAFSDIKKLKNKDDQQVQFKNTSDRVPNNKRKKVKANKLTQADFIEAAQVEQAQQIAKLQAKGNDLKNNLTTEVMTYIKTKDQKVGELAIMNAQTAAELSVSANQSTSSNTSKEKSDNMNN